MKLGDLLCRSSASYCDTKDCGICRFATLDLYLFLLKKSTLPLTFKVQHNFRSLGLEIEPDLLKDTAKTLPCRICQEFNQGELIVVSMIMIMFSSTEEQESRTRP